MNSTSLRIRHLGIIDYQPAYQAMQQFTAQRTAETLDELWVLQHPAVYTLGQAGKPEHVLNPKQIPVIRIDRGGQVTYHGIGQLIVYVLLDLKRHHWSIRQLVTALEQAVIDYLAAQQIGAERRDGAPGVYVGEGKIAALGLRVRHGCSYHGLSLNIQMDLSPFQGINPCGYEGLQAVQVGDFKEITNFQSATSEFLQHLCNALDYSKLVLGEGLPLK